MGVVHDITARSHAEEEISIFRNFADSSEQGLGMADLAGNITYANQTLCRFLGFELPEQACGTNVGEYYTDEDLPLLQNEILPTVMARGHHTVEIPLQSTAGKITPTIQSIFLIRDGRGAPYCIANVITDITDRAHIEENLRRKQANLSELVAEQIRQTH